jgi:cytochrome c oxidase subunit 1
LLGYAGQPRRYHIYPEEFQFLHVCSTIGSWVLGIGYLLPFLFLLHSLFYGEAAPSNPWGACGLEWQTSSPPPTDNFDQPPHVEEAYNYPVYSSDKKRAT